MLPDAAPLPALAPWCAGGKLPWDDPQFSERMLNEHLSQAHDEGSRRVQIIDSHVEWLHRVALEGKPSRILDLGCGPGLYTERLARLGHTCVGIDFSPAAIRYAKSRAAAQSLACEYLQQDLTSADFGKSFDFAIFLFGELNAFRTAQARAILRRACDALVPGGKLLLELFELQFLVELGHAPRMQNTVRSGVFSAGPYTRVTERKWFPEQRVTVERHIIMDAENRSMTHYANTLQAYTDHEYQRLLQASGFCGAAKLPCLGAPGTAQRGLCVLLSQRPRLGTATDAQVQRGKLASTN